MKASHALTLTLFLTAGCEDIHNPSGSCGTRSDGGRAGYHAPDGSTWVPDCQNPLLREYWRVFSDDGKSAYMIPRPDGAAEIRPVCADTTDPLRALVERYGLCVAASDAGQVNVINHMDLPDALQIARFLHTQLRFVTTTEPGLGISPFPIPSDIVDACAIPGNVNSADLEDLCQRERDRLRTGSTIAVSYTGPGAGALVARLNQLYGIP